MLLRKMFPEMPTTTVALDLISRLGSPTKYSLSPYQGMKKLLNKSILRDVSLSRDICEVFQTRDDFAFNSLDFICSCYEHEQYLTDKGVMEPDVFKEKYPEAIDKKDVFTAFEPSDKGAPLYIRRFEDGIPEEYMVKFVGHVISNITRQSTYLKDKVRSDKVSANFEDEEDHSLINANEMILEDAPDLADDQAILAAKQELAYCLYRMNMLSRRTHINILSLVFAYRQMHAGAFKSAIHSKPSELVKNTVYYADVNGDCTVPVKAPNDADLTKAREILDKGGGRWSEFAADYLKLVNCLTKLGIDARSDDPRRYSYTFIKRVSRMILVDNISYVTRRNGGYSKDIYTHLQNMSLDMAQAAGVEHVFNPLEAVIDNIADAEDIPSNILRAFSRTYPERDTQLATDIFPLYTAPAEYIGNLYKHAYNARVSRDGFLLDDMGDFFHIDGIRQLPSEYRAYTTGQVYFHASGYCVYAPVYKCRIVIMAKVRNFVDNLDPKYPHIVWEVYGLPRRR